MSNDKRKERVEFVEQAYDEVALTYHLQKDPSSNQELLERVRSLIPSDGEVLDVGCGSGIPVTKFFADLGYLTTGIDLSQSMIDLAAKNVPQATFLKRNMIELDFEEASFDAIVSFYALFHTPRELHERIIADFYKFLKPGGILLFSVGSTEWEGAEDFHGTLMWWSHYGPEPYVEFTKNAGFAIEFSEVIDDGEEKHFWIIGRKGT